MEYNYNQGFPDLNIPDSEKDEEWHRKYNLAICNQTFDDDNYDLYQESMNTNYNFFDGTQDTGKYDFLTENENGDALPALFIRFNRIRSKIEGLIGELEVAGYEISVSGVNKEFKVKKLDEKNAMLADLYMLPDMIAMEQATGIPTVDPQVMNPDMPQTKEEVDDFFKYKYKDQSEIAVKAILKALALKYDWEYKRVACFRNMLISGMAVVKTEIINGLPQFRVVHSPTFIYDKSAEDDYFSTSTYFGELREMSLADARSEWNLTKDEIDSITETSNGNGGGTNFLSNRDRDRRERYYDTNKVLVAYAEWEDVKDFKRKKSVDNYGNTHYKKVDEKKKGKGIVSKPIKIWRKCVLIGGKIVRDFGVVENMIRSVDDITDTMSNYTVVAPNYSNNTLVSKVGQMTGMQEAKDIALYQVQLAMARAGGKGFAYDVSQCPDGWEVEDVMSNLKSSSIVFFDSREDGLQKAGSPMKEFDLTISNSITSYINISQMYDAEMNAVTGISQERQGIVNAGSKTGVTNAAIYQSNLITAPLYSAFHRFSSLMFTKLAGLAKICWDEKESFAMLTGDEIQAFISQDKDLALNDYGVFIKELPKVLSDSSLLKGHTEIALSSGQITVVDSLEILKETDVDYAIKLLDKKVKEREETAHKRQMEMQQQAQQGQQQAAMQTLQAEQQHANMMEQAKGQRVDTTRAKDNQYRQEQAGQKTQSDGMLNKQKSDLSIREDLINNNSVNNE